MKKKLYQIHLYIFVNFTRELISRHQGYTFMTYFPPLVCDAALSNGTTSAVGAKLHNRFKCWLLKNFDSGTDLN